MLLDGHDVAAHDGSRERVDRPRAAVDPRAWWLELLVALSPDNFPRLQEIAVHPAVLAFTVVVSLATTLLFGSFTALKHALNVDAPATGAARGASASRDRNRTRSVLVVVQVALLAAFCLWPVFALTGRDYDAAVTTGGFMGFMLGTTANAMAVMRTLVERYGAAPRAFLVAPLVGASFIDFTNALIINGFIIAFE